MNKSISYIFLFALFLLLSCSDEQEGAPNAKPEVQGKTIALTFISQPLQESGVVTRSTGKGMDLLMGEESDVSTRVTPAEEQQIDNVCIFQFEGSKESSNAVLRAMFYQEKLTGNRQYIKLAAASAPCFLYVCANVGDLTNNYTVGYSTFEDLMDASLVFSGQDESNTLLPMSGCVDIGNADAVSIILCRMFAKVTFICDLSQLPSGDVFEITGVKLRNVPKSVVYYLPAMNVVTPIIDVTSLTGTPVVSDSKSTYVWYVPENLRGVGKNSLSTGEWMKRIERNAPNYATYIELMGDYIPSGGDKIPGVGYAIYLGNGTDVNNYDVQRNHSYQLTARIKGMNTTDLRVSIGTDLSADGLANCYLASEDNHWYRFNGMVRGNGNTEDYANQQYPGLSLMPSILEGAPDAVTIPVDIVKSVAIVWQTNSGIITQVEWDVNGSVRFMTGTTKGNALIAIKDAKGTILWSWHIWRTDGVDLMEFNKTHTIKVKTNTNREWYGNVVGKKAMRERELVMMECQIGAHLDRSGSAVTYEGNIDAFNVKYQFGRKDPIPFSTGYGGYEPCSGDRSTALQSLDFSIQHPDKLMGGASATLNWMYNAAVGTPAWKVSNCLWGDNNTSVGAMNTNGNLDPDPWGFPGEKGTKTIYDPCPAGWRVAPGDAWTGIADNNIAGWRSVKNYAYIGSFNKGYILYFGGEDSGLSTFYPASGYRDGKNSGTAYSQGTGGYGWLSSPCGNNSVNSTRFFFHESDNTLFHIADESGRSYAYSIRGVRE